MNAQQVANGGRADLRGKNRTVKKCSGENEKHFVT